MTKFLYILVALALISCAAQTKGIDWDNVDYGGVLYEPTYDHGSK